MAARRFSEEISTLIGKKVEVELSDGRVHSGNLLALSEGLDVVLEPAELPGVHKLIISGSSVREIRLVEKVFDLRELADRLSKSFPGNVTLREDIGAIFVMNRIKVTPAGVVEGSGPAAEKVRKIYEDYVREMREKGSQG
ncbi:MAG: Lsm family RNA-binding protein [Conexivisphaera sp.]